MSARNVQSAVDFSIDTYSGKLEFLKQTALLPGLLLRLEKFVLQRQPDVAINAMPGFWDLFVTRRLQKLGVPVITIAHDVQSHPGDWFKLLYWLQKHQILHSAGIVTLTDFIAENLKSRGMVNGQVQRVIPHPAFGFPDLTLPAIKKPGFPQHQPLRLLLVGRLQEYKGIGLFCDALKKLNSDRITVRVAGKGNAKDLNVLLNLANVEGHLGWCSETELINHIDCSDVIIAPYIEASQSGIIPLALSRGRPVIATPAGGLVEQIIHEQTGLLCAEISAEALAEAIQRFLDDPDFFQNCAKAALEYSKQNLAWPLITRQFVDAVHDLGS